MFRRLVQWIAACAMVATSLAIVAYCVLMYFYVTGKPVAHSPTDDRWDREVVQVPPDRRAGPLLESAAVHMSFAAESLDANSTVGWERLYDIIRCAPTVPDAPEVERLLANENVGRAIALFRQASHREHFGVMASAYRNVRGPADLVQMEAHYLAATGKADLAVEDAAALLRVARLLGSQPSAYSHQEAARQAAEAWHIASEILSYDVDDRHLDMIEATCQEFADEPRLDANAHERDFEWSVSSVYSPKGWRTLAGDELVNGSRFTHSVGPEPLPWPDVLLGPWLFLRAVGPEAEVARAREVAARYHESRLQPPSEWRRRVDQVPDDRTRYPVLAGWWPNQSRFMWLARARQQRDGVRAAVAILRFQRREGRWPTSLDELVPRDLTELPRDMVDSQPLRYRVYSDGPVLYCIGFDLVDDGGEPVREDDGVPDPFPEWWYRDESRERRQPNPGDIVLWPKPR